MNYEKLLIKRYKFWEVYLHENQCYLGRVYIWAIRKDALEFFDMTEEEENEYFKIGRELKETLKILFNPDLYNYATLANVSIHLHTHFIPRYKEKRELFGFEFKDEKWGQNYVPYNRDFILPEEILIKIKDLIKSNLH